MVSLIEQTGEAFSDPRAEPVPARLPRDWTWLNWVLTLLTAPAAVLVMMLALGAALNTTGCNGVGCPDIGAIGSLFNVLFYGAAVIAGMTMLGSFFTGTRPMGLLVPLAGWTLLAADVAALAVTFG